MTDLRRIVDVTVRITVEGDADEDAVLQTMQFGIERAVKNHVGEWGFRESELDAGDFCDPVEWEVLPASFYDYGGDPFLAKLKQEALDALNVVATTNELDRAAGMTFSTLHQLAVDVVARTQVALASHLGWLAENGEPKPDAPPLAVLLWHGDATVAQVTAL